MYKMRLIFFVVVLGLLMMGCTKIDEITYYMDENIDSQLKSKIDETEHEFFNALEQQDYTLIETLLSKELETPEIYGFLQYLSDSEVYLYDVKTLKEFYASSHGKTVSLESYIENYNLNLANDERPFYLKTLSYKSGKSTYILNFTFVQEEDVWKIAGINHNLLSICDLDAEKWIEKAIEFKDKGDIMPAFFYYRTGMKLSNPTSFLYHVNYEQYLAQYDLYTQNFDEKFKFPYTFGEDESKLKIFYVDFITVKDNPQFVVNVMTDRSFKDEAGITRIKDDIIAQWNAIENLGFTKGVNSINFQLYNEIPENDEVVEIYGIEYDVMKQEFR